MSPPVRRPAQRVRLGTHQRFGERLHHHPQQIRARRSRVVARTAGEVHTRNVGHRALASLEELLPARRISTVTVPSAATRRSRSRSQHPYTTSADANPPCPDHSSPRAFLTAVLASFSASSKAAAESGHEGWPSAERGTRGVNFTGCLDLPAAAAQHRPVAPVRGRASRPAQSGTVYSPLATRMTRFCLCSPSR